MRKLIEGIVEFRRTARADYREIFARLAVHQAPDALFVGCSDSRVVPNVFASADPGDLFVVRTVGNILAPAGVSGISIGDESEGAAIEYALEKLTVRNAIVCGHSNCGAMATLLQGFADERLPNLTRWLRHASPSLESLHAGGVLDESLSPADQLSQLNVLVQMEHLKTYPLVKAAQEQAGFGVHGWWFDIRTANVYVFVPEKNRFLLLDEELATQLLGNPSVNDFYLTKHSWINRDAACCLNPCETGSRSEFARRKG